MIFLTAGVVLHDRKGRVNLTPAFCVYGVFSRRDDSGILFCFYVAVRPAGGRSAIYAEDIVP